MAVVTFGAICDRYLEEELPERYLTAKSYCSNIKNYLKLRWGHYLLEKVRHTSLLREGSRSSPEAGAVRTARRRAAKCRAASRRAPRRVQS